MVETTRSWSRADCEGALYKLLQATLRHDALSSKRDAIIAEQSAAVDKQFSSGIEKELQEIGTLEAQLEKYYVAHRAELETGGRKCVKLRHGTIGMRIPTNPTLIALKGWSWDKITQAVIKAFKQRFILPPRPVLDKMSLKKHLTAEQLKKVGVQVDDSERFFVELREWLRRKLSQ